MDGNGLTAQPDCLRHFLTCYLSIVGDEEELQTVSATEEKLLQALADGNYELAIATETLANAEQDRLLIRVSKDELRLPTLEEIPDSSHDSYCFECHLPGLLEKCTQCSRAFHRMCYRKNPERPTYSVPSAKSQKNALPVFSSDASSDSEGDFPSSTVLSSTINDNESEGRATASVVLPDQTSDNLQDTHDSTSADGQPNRCATPRQNTSWEDKPSLEQLTTETEQQAEIESKSGVDVVCLGETRPPRRERIGASKNNISYKDENTFSDDVDPFRELCTCCRLLKVAALRMPPNMQPDELCHLIEFTLTRNRTWMDTDVHMYMEEMRLTAQERAVICKLLFKVGSLNLNEVAANLKEQKYQFLTEFLVDILDFQHCVGVFFGSHSTEFEATKWLVRDIAHDLAEIRRCPDCFRYSHEKTKTKVWFAKPCVQRHELVYAKHSGFPYWPAKVIRVLPNNKYDVRFFGGSHSRALIEPRHICSIDSEGQITLNRNSRAFKMAMEELRRHQLLLTYPPSYFSFHADARKTEELINRVIGDDMSEIRRGRKRQLDSGIGVDCEPTTPVNSGAQQLALTDSPLVVAHQRTEEPSPESDRRLLRSSHKKLVVEEKTIEEYKEEVKSLTARVNDLEKVIADERQEKMVMKRKLWCFWCLKEAIYLCCFRAAYCTLDCQMRHWNSGHNKVCKNAEQLSKAARGKRISQISNAIEDVNSDNARSESDESLNNSAQPTRNNSNQNKNQSKGMAC